jgi:16S rRNA G1207 methylase RsmC
VDAVVLRIPKQIPYLEYQLARLAGWLPAGTLLLAGGMDKHLSPHTAALIERYFGPTTRHRGQRKARVFSARRNAQPAPAIPGWASYDCDVAGGSLYSLPNVFSRDGLDIGSRFLLQQLHLLQPAECGADLACGNGVIGIAALRHGLSRSMYFCDESAMAIASARDNAARLAPPATAVSFHHGDGLAGLRQAFDLILCNPPFHLGHTVTEYAGRRLLAACASHLAPGGSLCLVANRHLDYGPTLRRHFRAAEQLAGNRKFVVWRALGG